MAARSRRLRLASHGRTLHLRSLGDWTSDPMDGVAECCRALMALEKALGESIRQARTTRHSWVEIGSRSEQQRLLPALRRLPTPLPSTGVLSGSGSGRREPRARSKGRRGPAARRVTRTCQHVRGHDN
jgi:hypothetical protein